MTVNEKIAKWLGWIPDDDGWCLAPGEGLCKGRMFFESMEFDTDITLWHGEDGLLIKIKEHGEDFACSFIVAYFNRLFGEGCWRWDFLVKEGVFALLVIMDGDSVMAAEALVQVIDAEFDKES